MKLTNTHKELLADISIDCIKNGVTLVLANTKKVKLPHEPDDFKTSGFFSDDDRILAVGTKRPVEHWFMVLLHEYNHMIQWSEGVCLTGKCRKAHIEIWDWLAHEIERNKEQLDEIFSIVRNNEKDCEYRTWQMIKDRPELGINPDDYVRRANSYLFSYVIAKRKRKWYRNPPYIFKEAVSLMPPYFVDNYDRVSVEFQKIIIRECF